MMYFLKVNDEATLSLPTIENFGEDFFADGSRVATVSIDVDISTNVDNLVKKFTHFYAPNSITSLSIIDENNEMVYTTDAYSQMNTMHLFLNTVEKDEIVNENDNDNSPVSLNLDFKA